MGYQALYRAWRPEKFSDVVGQEPIVTTLIHQIETGRIAHAYLFCGSRGTGKTSTAKMLARAINCEHLLPGAEPCGKCDACIELSLDNNMDVLEIDAASNNGVDEIRALRSTIAYPPSVGRFKVFIIDEVHMLSTGAFNALLKTLEEPPAHAVFILATTEPQKLPATILSRCQRFDFKRIPAKLIAGRLRQAIDTMDVTADDEALSDIARAAEGGMRDAWSLLDMALAYGSEHLTGETVREVLGTSDRSSLFSFADALIGHKTAAALTDIERVIADGRDPLVFSREVAAHMRALMLAQVLGDELADLLEVTGEDSARYRAQAKGVAREAIMRIMTLFMHAESEMKWAAQPRAVLELASVRACHPERESGSDALAERIENIEAQLKNGIALSAAPAESKEKPKEKEKNAAKPMQPKPSAPSVGVESEQWEKAKQIIDQSHKACSPLVQQAVFTGVDGDIATLEFPQKWKMYYQVLQSNAKKEVVEKALSEAFERSIRLRLALQGDKTAQSPNTSRQTLATAFDVFGRDNVVVLDD